MKIILTNDDGYNAEGINTLFNYLSLTHEVILFAPDKEKSAISNALSLHDPLRVKKISERQYKSTGTPVDCVLLAVNGDFLPWKPDLIISGINHGPNLGSDVRYSGTVGAALQGFFLGIKSIAVSLCNNINKNNFENASKFICNFIENNKKFIEDSNSVLNINIPGVNYNEIKGIKITQLAEIYYHETIILKHDPRGKPYYWIGGNSPVWKGSNETDYYAIENNFISITPLKLDWTNFDDINKMKEREIIF